MSNKKIIIIGILIITALAVAILLQKGFLNFRKNKNQQIEQSESGTSVSGAYTQTDSNGKVTAYDSTGNTMAQGQLQEDGTINWKLPKATPDMYGSYVTGYTPMCMKDEETPSVGWRIFYADEENVYLIADDYIENKYAPPASNGNTLDTNGKYKAYFSNILSSYSGSSDITNNHPAYKWIENFIDAYPNCIYSSMKAVAYMMDTTQWNSYYEDANNNSIVEYGIGGPTIELFVASYNQTFPNDGIDVRVGDDKGYVIKSSKAQGYTYSQEINISEDLYTKSGLWMWLASPWNSHRHYTDCLGVVSGRAVQGYFCSNTDGGFRPIVCLSSTVKLIDNGDGTYSIQ